MNDIYTHVIMHVHKMCMFIFISFTSNGVLTDSVTGGDGDPLGPVVNPKGGGFVILERRSN